ncbi:hypothetical protein KO465_00765 [Candidatus Micrarchaeota archaeon]|nr:hypothetical protein [Candidatus Micrarchaeota archaeon]
MEIILLFLAVGVGIILLTKSSDIILDKITALGIKIKLNDVVMGMVFLAFATALPEISITGYSISNGTGEIALGGVLGSNITNFGLALGIAFLMLGKKEKIFIEKNNVKKLLIYLTIAIFVVLVALTAPITGFVIGPILIFIFFSYVLYCVKTGKEYAVETTGKKFGITSTIVLLLAVLILILSSKLVVDNAVDICVYFNLQESFVGAAIIGVGTALPEIIILMNTAKRKKYLLVIGNAIGSSIINITLVIGILAVFSTTSIDLPILFVLGLYNLLLIGILGYFVAIRKVIDREAGLMLIGVYVLYLIILSSTQLLTLLN